MEIAILRFRRGVTPSYYLLGGLDRSDMPWEIKLGYVGPPQYDNLVWQLNDSDYRKISQNKVSEKALLQALGIPTAKFFGYLDADMGRDFKGRHLRSSCDLQRLFSTILEEHSCDRVCLKKPEGWNGSGFLTLTIYRDSGEITALIHQQSGAKKATIATLYDSLDLSEGYVVEAWINQHPEYAKFHPSSVNCYRVWVVLLADGTCEIPIVMLRFGCAGALVDAGVSDRLSVPIEPQTGRRLSAFTPTVERQFFTHHPDSGEELIGEALPYYHEAVDLAIESVRAFPGLRFAGVDVAVSSDGPMVVELNPKPNELGAARVGVPLSQVFENALVSDTSGS